jgi:hypothetical protein
VIHRNSNLDVGLKPMSMPTQDVREGGFGRIGIVMEAL